VLIIDALEGVRDQTRATAISCICSASAGCVVVNKMGRVDFAQCGQVVGDEISAHLTGLAYAHGGDPISARDATVSAAHAADRLVQRPTVVAALDALGAGAAAIRAATAPAGGRRSTSSMTAASSRAHRVRRARPGEELVIMPAAKIAKIRSVENWPVTPVNGKQGAGRSVASRWTASCRRARRHHRPCGKKPARYAAPACPDFLAA